MACSIISLFLNYENVKEMYYYVFFEISSFCVFQMLFILQSRLYLK
jgi:hypothetical protein